MYICGKENEYLNLKISRNHKKIYETGPNKKQIIASKNSNCESRPFSKSSYNTGEYNISNGRRSKTLNHKLKEYNNQTIFQNKKKSSVNQFINSIQQNAL
jgi:hypothetical protein